MSHSLQRVRLVPRPGEDLSEEEYRRTSKRYYFFRPRYPYLQRAWKKSAALDNRHWGGHLFTGDVRMYPESFVMRHYIFLSEARARKKYLGRSFDASEVANGWHIDKVAATPENLRFPDEDDARLHVQNAEWPHRFDTSRPFGKHYWEWDAC